MGLDVDYVFIKEALKDIEKVVSDIKHGERDKIADDIIEFAEEIKKKYGQGESKDW